MFFENGSEALARNATCHVKLYNSGICLNTLQAAKLAYAFIRVPRGFSFYLKCLAYSLDFAICLAMSGVYEKMQRMIHTFRHVRPKQTMRGT